MRQGAQGWCPGMTRRDGMRREVGGGFRMGNTCTPMEDSSQCMAKPVQYCKVKYKKKKERERCRFDPGLGRSHGEGNGNPLQHSYPENPMDRGAWRAIVHGVT